MSPKLAAMSRVSPFLSHTPSLIAHFWGSRQASQAARSVPSCLCSHASTNPFLLFSVSDSTTSQLGFLDKGPLAWRCPRLDWSL